MHHLGWLKGLQSKSLSKSIVPQGKKETEFFDKLVTTDVGGLYLRLIRGLDSHLVLRLKVKQTANRSGGYLRYPPLSQKKLRIKIPALEVKEANSASWHKRSSKGGSPAKGKEISFCLGIQPWPELSQKHLECKREKTLTRVLLKKFRENRRKQRTKQRMFKWLGNSYSSQRSALSN